MYVEGDPHALVHHLTLAIQCERPRLSHQSCGERFATLRRDKAFRFNELACVAHRDHRIRRMLFLLILSNANALVFSKEIQNFGQHPYLRLIAKAASMEVEVLSARQATVPWSDMLKKRFAPKGC